MSERTQDERYREQVRAWLAEHAAEYSEPREYSEAELVAHSKAWIRRKHQAGYSAIAEPASAGGAGGTARQAAIFDQEEAQLSHADHLPGWASAST